MKLSSNDIYYVVKVLELVREITNNPNNIFKGCTFSGTYFNSINNYANWRLFFL